MTDHDVTPSRSLRVGAAILVAVFSLLACILVLLNQITWLAILAVTLELAVVSTFCWVVLRRH